MATQAGAYIRRQAAAEGVAQGVAVGIEVGVGSAVAEGAAGVVRGRAWIGILPGL